MVQRYRVAESVTFMHPDKICDQISDLLLDHYLIQDPRSRVAIETIGGHGVIVLVGEVTSRARLSVERIVRNYYRSLTGSTISVKSHITQQSPEISKGVDGGGAGDQGIMVGYACRENDQYIPQELYLSRLLLRGFLTDGKSQVTMTRSDITSVVLSVQGKSSAVLRRHVNRLIPDVHRERVYANNTGAFVIGGFDADTGCTGRKIVIDAYGPRVPVGGGAFSGKDPTKVDRSAAYMARWIALQLLQKHGAQEVLVRLGYVIGRAEPLIQCALIDGRERSLTYDCRPEAIIERFQLRQPRYLDTARYGHVGRVGVLPWESNLS